MEVTGASGGNAGDAFTVLPSAPSPVGSSGDSWTGERGRFVPGTLIAGRFRIVALLGRGGMGEVYRAEDLRLDQAVALKFLPSEYSEDPGRLSRLLREVRLAREITHPSVCRVYDFFDTDGHRFVSMEYVDGENLAGLLRRIGRLPQAKALEITHQILSGLAAAHERGILHRDLKPENIMIDGRGHAHLMDFGIAALRESRPAASESGFLMGTPAYIAPELLKGKSASEQSDLYALGILLFELFTGQKPFKPKDIADGMRMHLEEEPPPPSSLVKDLDPAVSQAILRCLEKSPLHRHPSVRALAAELPGGDALANAMAAGLTPAPEVVADAEVGAQNSVKRLWLLVLGTLVSIGLYAWLTPRASLMGYLPNTKSAPVLMDRVDQVLKTCGWQDLGFEARGFYLFNTVYLMRVVRTGGDWRRIDQAGSPLTFHYYRTRSGWQVKGWPPPEVDHVILDHRGRLSELDIKLPRGFPDDGRCLAEPDWAPLFRAAELNPADFDSVLDFPLSSRPGDVRHAWVQRDPEKGAEPLRVMGISTFGRPTYFGVRDAERMASLEDRSTFRRFQRGMAIQGMIYLAAILLALPLAWMHLRAGRGDRQGAWRLAVMAFGIRLVYLVLAEWSLLSFRDPLELLAQVLGAPVAWGLIAWLLYMAAEPFMRRQWPRSLVAWVRLLGGRWRDPMVNQDVLVGLCIGSLSAMLLALVRAYPLPHNILPLFPFFPYPEALPSLSAAVAVILRSVVGAIAVGLGVLMATVLLWRLVRSQGVALVLVYLLFLVPYSIISGGSILLFLLVHGAIFLLPILLIGRHGLLAFVSFFFSMNLLTWVVGTASWDSWTGQHSLMALGILLALTLASFRFALGGRSAFP